MCISTLWSERRILYDHDGPAHCRVEKKSLRHCIEKLHDGQEHRPGLLPIIPQRVLERLRAYHAALINHLEAIQSHGDRTLLSPVES